MLIFFFLVESGEGGEVWEVWEMKREKTVFTTEENFVGLLRIQKRLKTFHTLKTKATFLFIQL